MLEALVSSRIRRTLFEHVLRNPSGSFYLRGLAKELDLSVSPLRRELLKHVKSGMLRTAQEGNMVFYTVNTGSSAFLQLQQAVEAPAQTVTSTIEPPVPSVPQPVAVAPALAAVTPSAVMVEPELPSAEVSSWANPLQTPMLLMVTSLGLVVMVVAAALFYLSMMRQETRDIQVVAETQTQSEQQLAVPSSASGIMQGQQWRLITGGFGGFASGSRGEAQ